jgi:hypothetical protein
MKDQPVLISTIPVPSYFLNHIQDFTWTKTSFYDKIKTFSYNQKDLAWGIESQGNLLNSESEAMVSIIRLN